MFKSSLKVYGKNIWEIFAVIGIISIGIFVGLWIAIPGVFNTAANTVDSIVNEVKKLGAIDFKSDLFMNSLSKQITSLDWANPLKTIQVLFSNDTLYNIIVKALLDGGLKEIHIIHLDEGLQAAIKSFTTGFNNQILYFVLSVAVAAVISYLATKLVIQIRSTKNPSAWRFVVSFFSNLVILTLAYFLIILSITKVKGVGLVFTLIAIFVFMLLITFIIAVLCYKDKSVKTSHILTFKNLGWLFLVTLIMYGISALIIIVIFFLSDFVALLMSIPLFLITSIITENIVINFVNDYSKLTKLYMEKYKEEVDKVLIK